MAASMVRGLIGGTGRMFGMMSNNFTSGCRSLSVLCQPQSQRLLSPSTYTQNVKKEIYPASSISLLKFISWPVTTSVRTVVRYSIRRGKKKTVKAVVSRFKRLEWGIYIRTRAGRNKKRWKKPDWIKERGQHHVFCNRQQSRMFDKMVTSYWKRKKNHVDDPYERYQRRFGMKEETAPKFLP